MASTAHGPVEDGSEHDWEAHDAMHTLMRAGKIVKNKKLMGRVKKHAARHAQESRAVAEQAEHLARAGRISPKAMEKLARA